MYATAFHTQPLDGYRFLVTGGAGFIGSHLVEYLLGFQAAYVRVLDNFSTGFSDNLAGFTAYKNLEIIEGDITDYPTCWQACKDIDFVFHQAALGSVPRSLLDPVASHQANVTGFLHILWASVEQKVKRVVYASSSSVYGDHPVLPKKEENTGKPLSPYALTKSMNEQYAQVFQDAYQLETIGLRYFNVFGPRQSSSGPYAAVVPLFIEALLNNRSAVIHGDGAQTRDFTFVENAVQANLKACFAPRQASGKVFNTACGERISIIDLFNFLQKETGATVTAQHRESRTGDVRDSLADLSNIQAFLGYLPQVSVWEGLRHTLRWFKQKNSLP